MSKKYLCLFFILNFGLLTKISAFTIEKFSVEQGLSNNNVVSIAQDKEGFMWFCTKDGLNRFDGISFKVFRYSKTDSNTICSNVLNCVYADKNNDIVWIGSEKNGIDAYNYKTHIFTHYRHDYSGENINSLMADGVTHITSDNEGNLWIATYMGGIDFFDKKTKMFTHYNQSNIQGLVSNYNWCIMYDSDEKIYVGHVNEGFSIINIKTMTAVNYQQNPNNTNSLAGNTVTSIYKDSQNRIWIGTRDGLTLFDPETTRMISFKHNPNDPNSLTNSFVQSITEKKETELWIGTEGGGVNILDLNQLTEEYWFKSISFKHIPISDTPDGLSSGSSKYILNDSYGNIWIGGIGGGINFIPNKEPFFNKISYLPLLGNENSLDAKSVSGMCVDDKDNIWVANQEGGISIYNKNRKIKKFDKIDDTPGKLSITYVYKDREGKIWIATNIGKIFQYDERKDKWIQKPTSERIKNLPIYSLYEDSRHNMWICTDVGLLRCNFKTKKQYFYNTSNTEIRDDNVRVVSEDARGNLWVGTLGGGLSLFNQNFKLLYNYGGYFNFYRISDIYQDSKGRTWIASQNDVFLFKNYNRNSVVRIGKDSGLLENDIRSIIEGQTADDIWLSTINGISHIDLRTMHISNFTINDKIARGDYIHFSKAKTKDGFIFFGSQNGIIWFNQVIEQADKINLKPVFTNFLITDKNKNLNELIDIPFSDSMILNYNQNTFQLFFNVLDFSISTKVEFAFQMKGLDDGWYLLNNDKQVIFRNLKPGIYAFNLKTKLHNTKWGDKISTMHIKIKPPSWLAWWAKLIYALLSVALIYFFSIFYKNKLKIENDLLLEKKSRHQEHDLNEEKLKFFTNITHELRTPMTLILGPLEDLLSDDRLTEDQFKKVNSIQSVANRLLQLINQILEFRKTQNKNRVLRVAKEDFVKYVSEIGLKYKELNQNSEIDFQIRMPEKKHEIFFDPEVISIIIDNLISNAFKYTKQGTIKLEIKQHVDTDVNYTVVSVKDTGYGISEADLPYIFDRYFQAKNTSHPIKGTGIGLALVKNLVELHEAEISVESQLNIGTTFKVKFITNNSYPEVLHISPRLIETEQVEKEVSSEKVVLVVDDNQEIVDYIQDNLIDNYKVLTAENGQIGYDIACEKTPDVIISDVMMPVMDGIEMCKKMKMDIRTSHIPVILLTAKGSTLDQSEGYSAGADSYLTKPFSVNLLKSRMTNMLKAREKLSSVYSSNFKNKQQLFNESTNQLDKEFLEKLTKLIEVDLEDEEMNISTIASKLSMSHSTLYRKIKALTNLTANEYIRKVRINVGEQLLVTNQYTISEIMYRVGINSSSYFRQCFKDEFGINPSEYLQKLKDETGKS